MTQTVKNPRTKHPSKGPPLAFFLCDYESIGPSSPLISETFRQLQLPTILNIDNVEEIYNSLISDLKKMSIESNNDKEHNFFMKVLFATDICVWAYTHTQTHTHTHTPVK